jgi:peptidoglycan/LPS O-acetylase OafA/YrhL
MAQRATSLRLEVLDGLRGAAILLVVAYHASLIGQFNVDVPVLHSMVRTGYLGVELFFALSGFCMLYPFACAYLRGEPLPTWKH